MKNLLFVAILVVGRISTSPAQTPVAGDVVITEIMANTLVIDDDFGEYFEICNIATHPVDLGGCQISDLNATTIVAATLPLPFVVQPGEFVVFCRDTAQAASWGVVSAVYGYVGCGTSACVALGVMNLGNGTNGDGIRLAAPSGTTIDVAGFGPLQTTSPFYNAFAAIPTASGAFAGGAYERVDLRAPWNAANVIAAINVLDVNGNKGTPGGAATVDATRPFLRAVAPLSVSAWSTFHLLSPRHANAWRILAGSDANYPGFDYAGFHFDLNLGPVADFILQPANGVFWDFGAAAFDAHGASTATVTLPPIPALVGYLLHFQYAVMSSTLAPVAVSDALAVTIQP